MEKSDIINLIYKIKYDNMKAIEIFKNKNVNKHKYTNSEFILICNMIHNNYYDYGLVEYINNNTKVKIICPEHGTFYQNPKSHMRGIGCKKCKGLYSLTTEEFIKIAKEIHGDIYDYSLVEYINNKTKVKIICPEHGPFYQTPNNHLKKKSKCPFCNIKNKSLTIDIFIEKSKKVHDNNFDYSLSVYKNNTTPVIIKCNTCNRYFEQTPNSHYVKKHGCPFCKESKGELEISKLLNDKKIKYIRQYKFDDCKNKIKLPFDFYLPVSNYCIEFDGEQHYKPIDFFGGLESFEKLKIRDNIKNEYCFKNNIKLLRIKYNENIKEKIKIIYG